MSDATQLTPEKIAQYRIEFADNENALIALDVIEDVGLLLFLINVVILFVNRSCEKNIYPHLSLL